MMRRSIDTFDAIVVGAGAAGVGVSIALRHAGLEKENFLVLDRHGVGASFERWPKEMRFITPSFATNSIGMLDLNSVAIGTSPAFSLGVEHPSGKEYAAYLQGVAKHFELPVRVGTNVLSMAPNDGGWLIQTNEGPVWARFVIWAAGEFQYPNRAPFPGSELCRHNSEVRTWEEISGEEVIVIGGYESGIDSAIHLARLGKKVTVLEGASPPPWKSDSSDPSTALSTYTVERLHDPEVAARVKLASNAKVLEVRRRGGGYEVCCRKRSFRTNTPPILATGFRGSTALVAELFAHRDDGFPLLTEQDESTVTTGLFMCGPMVRHDDHVFCFIYKFRQRFAVVAKTIAERLGLAADQLERYRQWGMYLDDLSCCGEECVC